MRRVDHRSLYTYNRSSWTVGSRSPSLLCNPQPNPSPSTNLTSESRSVLIFLSFRSFLSLPSPLIPRPTPVSSSYIPLSLSSLSSNDSPKFKTLLVRHCLGDTPCRTGVQLLSGYFWPLVRDLDIEKTNNSLQKPSFFNFQTSEVSYRYPHEILNRSCGFYSHTQTDKE